MIFLRGKRGTSQRQLTPTQGAVAKSWGVWGADGCFAPLSVQLIVQVLCVQPTLLAHALCLSHWIHQPQAFLLTRNLPAYLRERIYTDIFKVKPEMKMVLFLHTLIKMKCKNAAYMQVCNYCLGQNWNANQPPRLTLKLNTWQCHTENCILSRTEQTCADIPPSSQTSQLMYLASAAQLSLSFLQNECPATTPLLTLRTCLKRNLFMHFILVTEGNYVSLVSKPQGAKGCMFFQSVVPPYLPLQAATFKTRLERWHSLKAMIHQQQLAFFSEVFFFPFQDKQPRPSQFKTKATCRLVWAPPRLSPTHLARQTHG